MRLRRSGVSSPRRSSQHSPAPWGSDLAEDVAGQALLEAVEQWPTSGVPRNPAAWLTSVATRRAVDGWRRSERLDERYAHFARELENDAGRFDDVVWDPDRIDDDVLRLMFIACHRY